MIRDAIPLIPPLDKILHRPHRDPSNIRFHESGFLESHRVMLSQKTALLLKVSSITLATNDFGDFSKCLIVSTIYNDHEVQKVAEKAKKLWKTFAHEPQTARCLVFLLLLGALCKQMAKSYGKAAELLQETSTSKNPDSSGANSATNTDNSNRGTSRKGNTGSDRENKLRDIVDLEAGNFETLNISQDAASNTTSSICSTTSNGAPTCETDNNPNEKSKHDGMEDPDIHNPDKFLDMLNKYPDLKVSRGFSI
jgi:hypothetical protein